MVQDRLEQLKNDALAHFQKATSAKELYDFKVHYLGKSGQITEIMKDMGKLSKEERPAFGKKVNEVKDSLEASYAEIETGLKIKSWTLKCKVKNWI